MNYQMICVCKIVGYIFAVIVIIIIIIIITCVCHAYLKGLLSLTTSKFINRRVDLHIHRYLYS